MTGLPFHRRTITSGFGWRRDPITARKSHHNGVDFGVPGGSAITLRHDGHVIDRRTTKPDGNTVSIDVGEGLVLKYKHLRDTASVKVGDDVTAGQKIGKVGHTGTTARGDHLHLECWVNGSCVDPLSVLE